MVRCALAGVLAMAAAAVAKTVTYDFNVSWVKANPDGLFERDVVGINGEWPLPIIDVEKGDQLVVHMNNQLGDTSASIHFHGMYQNGTNEMDGASMVTQCPVPPGSSMTYNFTVDQNGTYWYHCHTEYCYPDGYRQALLVHNDSAPFEGQYVKEYVMTLSDWYHDMQKVLSKQFMSLYNPSGAEPIPNAFLLNDGLNRTFAVEPNSTYLLRIINIGAFVAQYFYIEGHNFTIVEVDGVYTEPQVADTLYISVAQRYSVLLTTKDTADVNYAIVTVADADLLDTLPSDLALNNTHWLVYDEAAPMLPANITAATSDDLVPYDDFALQPVDGVPLYEDPDIQINVTVYMVNLMTGYNYAMLNNITYTPPKVPTLYTALSAGDLRTNDVVYGEYTHPMILQKNQVVEIVVNNADGGTHPFHLHGHTFQVINRSPGYGPHFNDYLAGDPVFFDPNNHTDYPAIPIRRDTVVLPPQGYMVLRFIADNPGVWIFHCHIDWHLASGLAMVFVEQPDAIPTHVSIPDDHYAACAAAAVPSVGNAAGDSADFLNLKEQNVQPNTIPDGWTSRGEVAMAFSVLSAVLGIISLVIYGLADLKHAHKPAADAGVTPVAVSYNDGSSDPDKTVKA